MTAPARTEPEEAQPAAGMPGPQDPEDEAPQAEAAGAEATGAGAAEAEATDTGAAETGAAGTEMVAAPAVERDMSPIAVVGVILAVIALVGVAAGVLTVLTHGFHKKTVVTYQHRAAAVFSLQPGQCVNTSVGGMAFTRLACSIPHDAEVFARFTLTGASWPGTAAVQQEAGNGCAARLGGYLNPQLATAALAQAYVYPDEAAWKAGERTVICEVSSSTGQLTGSVRKAA
jgi:hypothetical protein